MVRTAWWPWALAGVGVALGVGLFLAVSVLSRSDVVAWARIDPRQPPPGACERSAADYVQDPRTALVECSEPHRAVVLGRQQVAPEQGPYPGDDVIDRLSTPICDRMRSERGPTDPRFQLFLAEPGAETWNDGTRATGSNEVVCLVVAADGSSLPDDLLTLWGPTR